MSRRSVTASTQRTLDNCADEAIREPGAIQPHGVLLALSEPDLTIVMASANAPELFGQEVLGALIDELVAQSCADWLRAADRELVPSGSLRVRVREADIDLVAHRSGGLLVTEWEPIAAAQQSDQAWHSRLPQVLQRLSGADTLDELVTSLVTDVRALTGFDRVMIYRFDPQWNGEVIAEDRRDDLEPFLGLHYPAADIPAQARALYEQNWLRLIPDATYRSVQLTPGLNPRDGRPWDLSASVLRSVSPVHLQYLANMGVKASMSVSLLDRGRLWGLIACHHYQGPHRPAYNDRMVAEFLGRTVSVLLASKTETASGAQASDVAARATRLMQALARAPRSPLIALTAPNTGILDLIPATGAAIQLDGRLTLLGHTPPPDRVIAVVSGLLAAGSTSSTALGADVPDASDVADSASGLLAVPTDSIRGDFLAWFREETLRQVTWAGDPNTTKAVQEGSDGRLSPRRSFASWSETVRGTAPPWHDHEITAARELGEYLTESSLRRADEDNRLATTLQRTLLLERLPDVPGVALAAHYVPAAHDVVGGDWYDLVLLPSGRISIVLGDVAGHGLSAAAITAQLRHGLRAYLLRDAGPRAALTALNRLVTALLPGELATAIVAELDPATGSLTFANAGHPPALLLTDHSSRLLDDARGPALGLSDSVNYAQGHLTLVGADRLVLYSDGLIERRGTGLQADLDRLLSASTFTDREPHTVLDNILRSLAPTDADDVTLLAVGLSAEPDFAHSR